MEVTLTKQNFEAEAVNSQKPVLIDCKMEQMHYLIFGVITVKLVVYLIKYNFLSKIV